VIPRLPAIYDEPFADSSQIPTFLVAQMARRHVTVCLTGDGGDELFGGYSRYAVMIRLWRTFGWMPHSARRLAAAVLRNLPGPRNGQWPQTRRRWAQLLSAPSFVDAYRHAVSLWKIPGDIVVDGGTGAVGSGAAATIGDRYRRMMFIDAMTYLPDDILVKVDRATMANSLECRAPLLDHRVAEFAARLPKSFLYRDGQGKWLLRKVLERYVPRSLFDRPRKGFSALIGAWLRGPLRDWANDLLAPESLRSGGYWNTDVVRSTWMAHTSHRVDASARLWPVLMFQSWLAEQRKSSTARRVA
jgi:asparagine synthase (glutamine-hydrolysing)